MNTYQCITPPWKIQNEATRIATGATKLVSVNKLYKEICWESLQKRRHDHKRTLFYKIYNHLAPEYLSSLIPQQVNDISRYNLRNSHNIQTIRAKTNQYNNSFYLGITYEEAAVLRILTSFWKISLTHPYATVVPLKMHSITFPTVDSINDNAPYFWMI